MVDQVQVTRIEKPIRICLINGVEKECMIDMGSECSLIQEKVARELQLEPEKTDNAIVAFNKTVGLPIAKSKVNVRIDGIKFETTIYILPNDQLGNEILLGREMLALPGVQAVSNSSGIKFINKSENINKELEVNLITREMKPLGNDVVLCEDISYNDKHRLLNLLNSYRRNVAISTSELSCADVPGMQIKLTSSNPVVYPPYRLARFEREKVKEIISVLESSGIIRESSSPYASPIVLTKKKKWGLSNVR